MDQIEALKALVANHVDVAVGVSAIIIIGVAVALGVTMHYAWNVIVRLMGKWKMKQRAKFLAKVREAVEDCVVEGLSEGIYNKRIAIEDAREVYAMLARFGFWGLHPRKFSPKKTPEELQALKMQLATKRAANGATKSKSTSTSGAVDKLLAGLDAELA